MLRRSVTFSCILTALAFLAAGVSAQEKQSPQKQSARLKVLVPRDDAELTIDGKPTKQTGKTREFETPPLEPGNYLYTVTAVIKPNNYTTITRTREIKIQPGKEVEVDLRQPEEKFPDKIVIRYVPTPQEVVDEMLKLGKVGQGDIVFDLGCGDGRIVVSSVKKAGAKRGIGVDIDPERIREAKVNAKEAGVEEKVEFRQQDVLQLKDLSDATVVMLYMGNELNMALRPILWKLLKPGTRVVSHRFTMGDWKSNQTITVHDNEGEKYLLHLWIITGEEGKKTGEEGKKKNDQ
jgi:uncharacterized protein (TIGR03000 family)